MDSSLLSSKTMRLVLITMALIVSVFLAAAVLEAVFQVHVPYVGETFAALTGNSGIGAARNAYVDGPLRAAMAQPRPGLPPPPVAPLGKEQP